jgi:predicted nucleic acid-binding protein
MIGLDTTAIIDLFRGNSGIKTFLEQNTEPLSATTMSYLELFFGLDTEKQAHREEAEYYRKFFATLYSLNLSPSSCEKAAEIHFALMKKGQPIQQFDCTIAAIFIENGITKIVTRNTKDFRKIPGIETVSY